jgi:RimJ/RimL family protein N-acetyltransferase
MSGSPGHRLPSSFEPLGDGVVTLRRFTDGDVSALTACLQDPEIPRWTRVPAPYAEQDAREYLVGGEEAWQAGEEACLAIVEAGSGELLGSIGLVYIEWEDERAEIGYWVAAPARRTGVATRAVRLLARWAFVELGLFRLEILPDVENEASLAVARACGFREEGILRANTLIKGRRGDNVVFSLLASDPPALELLGRGHDLRGAGPSPGAS